MENGWNLFNNNSSSSCVARGNHNDNCTSNDACAFWESGTTSSRILDWNNNLQNPFNHVTTTTATAGMVSSTGPTTVVASSTSREEEVAVHALMFNNGHYSSSVTSSVSSPFSSCLYSRGGSHSHCYPDPHLMCLKLGKRHYFGEATPLGDRQGAAASSAADAGFPNTIITKRGKPYYDAAGLIGPSTSSAGVTVAATPAVVPRCQVDGCHVALLNAKDYHRRHKVCEMHSKAPKVVVLGHEQRFCQQCSRFHAVGEFDESKRSCRRRLAGHNERRRKSSQDQSAPRNHSQVNGKLIPFGGRHPHFPLSSGCALSLLSSKNDSWISSSDLPARCSAALRELIAENRAAILSRQLILDKDLHWHHHHHPTEDLNGRQNGSNSHVNFQQPMATGSHSWDHRISEEAEGHVTLDLMQAPNSAFGFLSVREKSNEDDECPELWGSFGGAHVV